MTWMITTASSRSRATVSSSMPRSSGPIQTRRASATSVEGTACGSTVVMTCIAWALPMRWRRAERYHRTSRSTSLVWHRTSGRWRSPVRPRLPTSPIAGSVAGQSRTPALRHQRTFAQHGSSEGCMHRGGCEHLDRPRRRSPRGVSGQLAPSNMSFAEGHLRTRRRARGRGDRCACSSRRWARVNIAWSSACGVDASLYRRPLCSTDARRRDRTAPVRSAAMGGRRGTAEALAPRRCPEGR